MTVKMSYMEKYIFFVCLLFLIICSKKFTSNMIFNKWLNLCYICGKSLESHVGLNVKGLNLQEQLMF